MGNGAGCVSASEVAGCNYGNVGVFVPSGLACGLRAMIARCEDSLLFKACYAKCNGLDKTGGVIGVVGIIMVIIFGLSCILSVILCPGKLKDVVRCRCCACCKD